jgi:hypothetical protein
VHYRKTHALLNELAKASIDGTRKQDIGLSPPYLCSFSLIVVALRAI